MGLLDWLKPNFVQPPPRLRLVVYCSEETLPCPLQIVHPDGLWGAIPGAPVAMRKRPDERLPLEQSMEPGDYLLRGPDGDVLARVEEHPRRTLPSSQERPFSSHPPVSAGVVERHRLENTRWAITLEMAQLLGEVRDLVLYQMRLADRVATLVEGVVLDQFARRYYLPGRWRVQNALEPIDAREHVVLHLEVADRGMLWVHTHGLSKFGRPEMEIPGVPELLGDAACRLLMDLCQRLLSGSPLRPGQKVGDPGALMVVRPGRREASAHFGSPSLELVDLGRDGKPASASAVHGIEAYRQPPGFLSAG